MKQLCINYMKINILVLFSIFAMMMYTGSALAGDYTMQNNLKNLSELTIKWSKQFHLNPAFLTLTHFLCSRALSLLPSPQSN